MAIETNVAIQGIQELQNYYASQDSGAGLDTAVGEKGIPPPAFKATLAGGKQPGTDQGEGCISGICAVSGTLTPTDEGYILQIENNATEWGHPSRRLRPSGRTSPLAVNFLFF